MTPVNKIPDKTFFLTNTSTPHHESTWVLAQWTRILPISYLTSGTSSLISPQELQKATIGHMSTTSLGCRITRHSPGKRLFSPSTAIKDLFTLSHPTNRRQPGGGIQYSAHESLHYKGAVQDSGWPNRKYNNEHFDPHTWHELVTTWSITKTSKPSSFLWLTLTNAGVDPHRQLCPQDDAVLLAPPNGDETEQKRASEKADTNVPPILLKVLTQAPKRSCR